MLKEITEILKTAGISNYEQEANWIAEKQDAIDLAHRRAGGEPLQYVLGEWDFYNITIKTACGAFIPRPETEELVEYALKIAENIENPRILDLCTGTGAIALAMEKNLSKSEVYALEFSKTAIEILKENIALLKSEVIPLFACVFYDYDCGLFDIITCNPPYLNDYDMANLDSSVQDPYIALQGEDNPDGLRYYREITQIWKEHLKPNGIIIYEIGETQALAVTNILKENDFSDIEIIKDLCGKDRIVKGKYLLLQ